MTEGKLSRRPILRIDVQEAASARERYSAQQRNQNDNSDNNEGSNVSAMGLAQLAEFMADENGKMAKKTLSAMQKVLTEHAVMSSFERVRDAAIKLQEAKEAAKAAKKAKKQSKADKQKAKAVEAESHELNDKFVIDTKSAQGGLFCVCG